MTQVATPHRMPPIGQANQNRPLPDNHRSWPAGEQHPKSDNRGDQHDDAAHQSGQFVVEIAALRLALTFPALGFGLMVIGVDVHHAVADAEVDETEHTRGHAQEHHAYRPALLDAQGR